MYHRKRMINGGEGLVAGNNSLLLPQRKVLCAATISNVIDVVTHKTATVLSA